MRRINLILTVFLLALFTVPVNVLACTSFIVSGKATKDGRPLLFKNRDTNDLNNYYHYFKGSKYDFLGDISNNPKSQGIWFGHNTAGFAIMNTAAYNLNPQSSPEDRKQADGGKDGIIMRLALEQCANLKDFETLLDTLPKPLACNSNFGVIDANGGCAYYETGNNGYVKFDVNDPKIAPLGYIVRTNFGFSGDRTQDKGISRFNAISDICLKLSNTNDFSVENILGITRYLKHGLTAQNLYDIIPPDSSTPQFVAFRDFIPRYLTASSVLIQGVKPGESPLLTVSWTIIGSPLTTVVVPVMIAPSKKSPSLLDKTAENGSVLSNWGLTLKKDLFPIERGEGADYINLSKLINSQNTGILQKVKLIEKEIVTRGEKVIEDTRKKGKADRELEEYYEWLDKYIRDSYRTQFDLN